MFLIGINAKFDVFIVLRKNGLDMGLSQGWLLFQLLSMLLLHLFEGGIYLTADLRVAPNPMIRLICMVLCGKPNIHILSFASIFCLVEYLSFASKLLWDHL